MLKSALILAALITGLFLPALDAYSWTLRPFLMALLFFAFVNVRIDRSIFARQQAVVAVMLPLLGLGSYYLAGLYAHDLALTILLMGLAPTAVITPVLAAIMERDAGYMVGAILVTHLSFALIVPFVLPWVLGVDLSVAELGRLLYTIGSTVAGPLVLGQLARKIGGRLLSGLRRIGPYSFVLFLSNITVAAGSLSYYLRYDSDTSVQFVVVTVCAITALVLFNFWLGARTATSDQKIEGSLTLGRKNTMLSIWIALEYISPLIVLGPMLYILVQNVVVAVQIVYVSKRAAD